MEEDDPVKASATDAEARASARDPILNLLKLGILQVWLISTTLTYQWLMNLKHYIDFAFFSKCLRLCR